MAKCDALKRNIGLWLEDQRLWKESTFSSKKAWSQQGTDHTTKCAKLIVEVRGSEGVLPWAKRRQESKSSPQ